MLTLTIDIVVKDPDSGEIVYPSAGDYDYSPPACQAGVFSLSWFTAYERFKIGPLAICLPESWAGTHTKTNKATQPEFLAECGTAVPVSWHGRIDRRLSYIASIRAQRHSNIASLCASGKILPGATPIRSSHTQILSTTSRMSHSGRQVKQTLAWKRRVERLEKRVHLRRTRAGIMHDSGEQSDACMLQDLRFYSLVPSSFT